MADAHGSGPCERKFMGVQVPSSALTMIRIGPIHGSRRRFGSFHFIGIAKTGNAGFIQMIKTIKYIITAAVVCFSFSFANADDEGWLWPVPDNLTIYSPMQEDRDGRPHRGIDISSFSTLDVVATRSGVVDKAEICGCTSPCRHNGEWGNVVYINHNYGYTSIYAHLEPDVRVSEGQVVRQGELIGRTGNSGKSTGRHLHFQIMLYGVEINANPYDGSVGITSNYEKYYTGGAAGDIHQDYNGAGGLFYTYAPPGATYDGNDGNLNEIRRLNDPNIFRGKATVAYSGDGGRGGPQSHIVYKDGDGAVNFTVQPQIPVKKDFFFTGWLLADNPDGATFAPGETVTVQTDSPAGRTTLRLHAQWAPADAGEPLSPISTTFHNMRFGSYPQREPDAGEATVYVNENDGDAAVYFFDFTYISTRAIRQAGVEIYRGGDAPAQTTIVRSVSAPYTFKTTRVTARVDDITAWRAYVIYDGVTYYSPTQTAEPRQ